MATTMKDVARRAGVDVSTVSLAINNDPRIRAETRARILSIASELGYQKNHLARGLRSGKSFTIGAVCGYATAFWGEVLAGAQSVLAERDYHLLLDYAPDRSRREETQIGSLAAKRVDGMLIAPADGDASDALDADERTLARYRELRADGIPFVFVDRFVPGLQADIVTADNRSAAEDATRHLLDLGHRRVVYLYAPHRMNTAQRERLEGYERAMRAAGLRPDHFEVVAPRADRSEEGREAARELLLCPLGRGMTALLAATDSTAIGAMRGLRDAGRRVPEDVSVMGFGGTSTSDYTNPPLTTMRLPMRDLGAEAARRLLRRIEGDTSPFEHKELPTERVVRASTGPPR